MDHESCCPVLDPLSMFDVSGGIWVPHRAAVLEMWADQTPIGIGLDGLGNRF